METLSKKIEVSFSLFLNAVIIVHCSTSISKSLNDCKKEYITGLIHDGHWSRLIDVLLHTIDYGVECATTKAATNESSAVTSSLPPSTTIMTTAYTSSLANKENENDYRNVNKENLLSAISDPNTFKRTLQFPTLFSVHYK